MSGEQLNISPNNKCLQVRIPKSIDLNIHSTSADVIAEKLEHDNILIVTMSGNVEITEIVSNNADFSSNSGHIELDMIASDKLSLSTSSGHIKCNSVQVDTVDAKSSTGDISFGNIAEQLDVSEKTISKWECGNGLPEVTYMEALCEILGITVNELLMGEKIDIAGFIHKLDCTRLELLQQLEFEQLKMRLYKFYGIEIEEMEISQLGAGSLTYFVKANREKY